MKELLDFGSAAVMVACGLVMGCVVFVAHSLGLVDLSWHRPAEMDVIVVAREVVKARLKEDGWKIPVWAQSVKCEVTDDNFSLRRYRITGHATNVKLKKKKVWRVELSYRHPHPYSKGKRWEWHEEYKDFGKRQDYFRDPKNYQVHFAKIRQYPYESKDSWKEHVEAADW